MEKEKASNQKKKNWFKLSFSSKKTSEQNGNPQKNEANKSINLLVLPSNHVYLSSHHKLQTKLKKKNERNWTYNKFYHFFSFLNGLISTNTTGLVKGDNYPKTWTLCSPTPPQTPHTRESLCTSLPLVRFQHSPT